MAKKLPPDEERLLYEALAHKEADWRAQTCEAFLARLQAREKSPLAMSFELSEWLKSPRGNRDSS